MLRYCLLFRYYCRDEFVALYEFCVDTEQQAYVVIHHSMKHQEISISCRPLTSTRPGHSCCHECPYAATNFIA